jgi:hypothetical protein
VDVTKNQIDTDEMCTCVCMERVQDTHINNCSLSLSLSLSLSSHTSTSHNFRRAGFRV